MTETAGVSKIVYGTYEETEKLASLAKEHDIVINAGSSVDPTSSHAIVAGLNERPAGVKTTLIHMSGAGNFVDATSNTGSTNPNAKVWNVGQSYHFLETPCLIETGCQYQRYGTTPPGNVERPCG